MLACILYSRALYRMLVWHGVVTINILFIHPHITRHETIKVNINIIFVMVMLVIITIVVNFLNDVVIIIQTIEPRYQTGTERPVTMR